MDSYNRIYGKRAESRLFLDNPFKSSHTHLWLADILQFHKLMEIPHQIAIFCVYQHLADAIKDRRWSMKVSKAVNLFLDYHKMNSQKKYDPGLRSHFGQIHGLFS